MKRNLARTCTTVLSMTIQSNDFNAERALYGMGLLVGINQLRIESKVPGAAFVILPQGRPQ